MKKYFLCILFLINIFDFVQSSCQCGPNQNVSASSIASISVGSPSENGISCGPIICSTTILLEDNSINGCPVGATVKILPCQNLSNANTVTLRANNQTFNSCQSDVYSFTVTDTNVFTFVFKIQTPIFFIAVLQPTPQPTTTIPKTTTVNYQQIKADVVIILDGSDTLSNKQKTDVKLILNEAFNQYNIYEDYINIAVIVALGDQFPVGLVKNTFGSVKTLLGLQNALNNAFENSDFEGGSGQDSLSFAVKQINNPDFLNQGYRHNIKNHLAIYVTTTNSPNQAAINEARKAMQQNLFQFIAVGYQGSNNQQALANFVGNSQCALVSSNSGYISKTISGKIEYANFNNGKYC